MATNGGLLTPVLSSSQPNHPLEKAAGFRSSVTFGRERDWPAFASFFSSHLQPSTFLPQTRAGSVIRIGCVPVIGQVWFGLLEDLEDGLALFGEDVRVLVRGVFADQHFPQPA